MTRSFLGAAAFALASAMITATGAAQPSAEHAVESPRRVTLLADGWRFFLGDPSGAQSPQFDDSRWQTVSVPHTWNRVGNYLTTDVPHANKPENLNKVQGVGWYRLHFATPPHAADKQVWLEFDAASRAAEIWLNGRRLGEHRGGFSRFRFNATASLSLHGENILSIRTDNSAPAPGSSTSDIFPLAGDFFVHGGLYRPVRLVVTSSVQIDMLDSGGPGVYARTDTVDAAGARVNATVRVRNSGPRATNLSIRTLLVDAAGMTVASSQRDLSLAAGANTDADASLLVGNPRLWQGVDDPYLYKLVAEVRVGSQLVDSLSQDFGIRQMRFDPQTGFYLNGKPYKLRGVGYHQDHEGKGWAISEEDVARDIDILRDMGVTSIRLTHYQHGEPIHRLADRAGIILWDEVAVVSTWTLGKEEAMPRARLENVRQQMRELIRQNYNHASVAVWGLANEVDFGNSLPGFVTPPNGQLADPLVLLNELKLIATAEDRNRPTTLATCCEGRLFGPGVAVPITAGAADLGGANRYFGWYYGVPSDLAPHLQQLRGARPSQPLAITEYGAGGAISMHSDNPLGGPVDSRGRNQPEEYMSYVHEANWAILKDQPYLWATWLWSGFDFATTVRREGDADDINTKGLVTYDRLVKKDPYFFYRANWSSNPTVHIAGRRYADRAYGVTDIKVYSNAPSTELLLNGRSLGTRANCVNMVCVWSSVRLDAGANKVVARATFGNSVTEDAIVWTLADDVAKNMRIDSGALMAAASQTGRFGSDDFFEGGTTATVNAPANYGRPAEAKAIAGSADSAVLATYREGNFNYRLPLAPGRYTIRLSFIEPLEGPGSRLFNVSVNGKKRLSNLDVAAAAGAPLTLLQRSIPARVSNGPLMLSFEGVKGKALVSAVEILRND